MATCICGNTDSDLPEYENWPCWECLLEQLNNGRGLRDSKKLAALLEEQIKRMEFEELNPGLYETKPKLTTTE